VVVTGQGRCDAPVFHEGEGGAVGQRPFLVGAGAVQFAAPLKEGGAGGDDFGVGLGSQERQQPGEPGPIFRLAHGVAHFGKHKFGGNQQGAGAGTQGAGLQMPLVRRVKQGQKISGVGEDGGHRRGAPWR